MSRRWLCQPLDIALPRLDPSLAGLTIAHLTDMHVSGPWRRRWDRLLNEMAQRTFDLILITGDQMHHPGDEEVACRVLARLLAGMRSRLGVFGVFGNHDTPLGRQRMRALPGIVWLDDQGVWLADGRIRLWGQLSDRCRDPDALQLLANLDQEKLPPTPASSPRPLTLLMTHYPMELPTAADLGVDLMFSGHTHGGQWRLPWPGIPRAFYNSSDLPMHLTCGLLAHRRTLAAVSRGLGESSIPMRFFCPAHVPIYRLTPYPADATPMEPEAIINLHPF